MLTGSIGEVALPEELHDATKLTVYCGRYERYGRRPAFVEIVDMLHRSGAIGANVLLGVDGTVHGARQRARFFGANARVPLMIIGVGRGDQMSRLLPDIAGLLERPLLTLERVRLCKAAGQRLDVPHQPTVTDETGMRTWVKVMVHAGQDAQHAGRPLYVELVRRLREAKAAGATVVQGIWGFQAGGAPQGDKLLALRRHVPTLTIVIDEPARIGGWFEIVDELTDEAGLVTSELVPALRARGTWGEAGGLRLAQKTG
jgi:PII-like signaling protein